MGIGSPRLRRSGVCAGFALAAWLLPAQAAHADVLPQLAATVTAATTAVEATEASVAQTAAPLVDTGRAVATSAVSAATRAPEVTAPVVRPAAEPVSRPVPQARPESVAAAAAPVTVAPTAVAASSPGAAVGVHHHQRAAAPHAVAQRRTVHITRTPPTLGVFRPLAPAPHGSPAHDTAVGGAAGAVAAAASPLRLPFFGIDVRAPATAVRLRGVVLLLALERPD